MNKAVLAVMCVLLVGSGAMIGFFAALSARAAPSGNIQTISFSEPPPLASQPSNFESVVHDLEGIGCKIIQTDSEYVTYNMVLNYTEFRRLAYNTGVAFAFCFGNPLRLLGLYTVYSGILFSCRITF